MKKIKIFNEEILVYNALCSTNKDLVKETQPSLKLYIKLTDNCNADCKFCSNKGHCDYKNIDLSKLEFVINYLNSKNYLHGISITGGEPLTNPDKLFLLLDIIYKINPNLEIQISTNGLNLKELKNYDKINKLESIHISKHHYNDSINNEIFNSNKVAKSQDIIDLEDFLEDKRIININTLVMKDYINNLKEIKKMLNHVANLGVYKNGFVSLMKCNEYAKAQFINFNDIFNNLDDSFLLGHHFYRKEYCECIDCIYLTNNNKLIEFYARMVKESNCPYINQLVYSTNNELRANFSGKILYK